MNLKQFLDLYPLFRDEGYALIQTAYEVVVNRIKIKQQMFPVIMQKAFRSNGFLTKHTFGNNKICFKEIKFMNNAILANPNELNEDLSSLELFTFDPYNYHGIGEERFKAVNEDHTKMPKLQVKGDIVECDNIDGDVFFFLYGYPYPYFVRPIGLEGMSNDGYDINAMITNYTEEGLVVEDVLAMLMIPKLHSIIHQRNNDLGQANSCEYVLTQILNRFNSSRELFRHNDFNNVSIIPYNP